MIWKNHINQYSEKNTVAGCLMCSVMVEYVTSELRAKEKNCLFVYFLCKQQLTKNVNNLFI